MPFNQWTKSQTIHIYNKGAQAARPKPLAAKNIRAIDNIWPLYQAVQFENNLIN